MNIYAKEGDRVIFNHPNAGYDGDIEKAQKLLKEGCVYTVDKTDVHSWLTQVYLKELPNVCFNSVQFEDVDKTL